MGNTEQIAEIKSKIKKKETDFQAVCSSLFLQEKVTKESISFLLHLLVNMYEDQILSINTVAKISAKGYRYIIFDKTFFDTLQDYYNGIHNVREAHYNLLSFFLSMCMQKIDNLPEKTIDIIYEKKEFLLDKVLPLLQKRPEEEKDLYYVPAYVLDLLSETIWGNEEEVQQDKDRALKQIKEMDVRIKNLSFLKRALEKTFRNLKEIICAAVEIEGIEGIATLCLEAKKVCGVEGIDKKHRKVICMISHILFEETRKAIFKFFSDFVIFFDPSSPKLASTLVVKTRERIIGEDVQKNVEIKVDEIITEILGSMLYPNVYAKSIFFNIGSEKKTVSPQVWNALGKIFKLDLLQCQIKFAYTPFPHSFCVLENFFLSEAAAPIIHLSIFPLITLSSQLISILNRNITLESLSLFEPVISIDTPQTAIKAFFSFFSKETSIFQYLKYLTLSFSYSEKTFMSISQRTYSQLEKLEIRFLGPPEEKKDKRGIDTLFSVINRGIFPNLKELSLHNSNLTKSEYKKMCSTMRMVQTKYGGFYCPMGACYMEQDTYIFKFSENMSLNAGVVFIVEEKVVANWISIPENVIPQKCLLCKVFYKKENKNKLLILSCGNIFHIDCVSWSKSLKKNPCCPLCKRKVHMHKGLVMAVYTLSHKREKNPMDNFLSFDKQENADIFDITY